MIFTLPRDSFAVRTLVMTPVPIAPVVKDRTLLATAAPRVPFGVFAPLRSAGIIPVVPEVVVVVNVVPVVDVVEVAGDNVEPLMSPPLLRFAAEVAN